MGPDNCHPRVLQETADIVDKPFQTLFDKSFSEDEIPSVWKNANITAFYKN